MEMKHKTGAGIKSNVSAQGHVQIAGRKRVWSHFTTSVGAFGVSGAVAVHCLETRCMSAHICNPIIIHVLSVYTHLQHRVPTGLNKRGQKVLSITLPAVLQCLSARD